MAVYETARVREGAPRKGTATAVSYRSTYSLDDRVAVSNPKSDRTSEQFPVMQMNWIERYAMDRMPQQEMVSSVLAVDSIDGHIPGLASKVDFSQQGWSGQLFHQLLFDASGVRSHQYSYFENEGDEQITLAYPNDGMSADALWFWVRGMAAPALQPGETKRVMLLNSLVEARTRHRALKWQRAVVGCHPETESVGKRTATRWTVDVEGGVKQVFLVEASSPFAVLHWESSEGERADLVSVRRIGGLAGK